MSLFLPTPEHEAIFSAVRSTRCNVLIEAVAGAGKTTTLLELLRVLPIDPESILPPATCFLAFNKEIAETLKARVPRHVSCSTFHSLGFRALRRKLPKIETDFQKVPKLLYARLGREHDDFDSCKKLVSLLKSSWPTPQVADLHEAALELVSSYDLLFQETRSVSVAVDTFSKSISNFSSCDFDDMLFLPVLLDAPFDQQDYILGDEMQDSNDIQLEILFRLGHAASRYFFVGDHQQAIYGFRGASADALTRVRERFSTKPFPLSVTYRCSKAVVEEVQHFLRNG